MSPTTNPIGTATQNSGWNAPREFIQTVHRAAGRHGMALGEMIREALPAYLEKLGDEELARELKRILADYYRASKKTTCVIAGLLAVAVQTLAPDSEQLVRRCRRTAPTRGGIRKEVTV